MRSMNTWDLPGGPVVNNPPSSAGNAGSIPDQGAKILHTSEQFSLSERCNPTQPKINKIFRKRIMNKNGSGRGDRMVGGKADW